MLFTFALPLLFLTLTVAQNITTSLFLYGGFVDQNDQPFVASVLGSSPSATTYLLDCNDGSISELCGLVELLTLVEGPSTAAWSTYFIPGITVFLSCTLTGTTTGTCIGSQTSGTDFTSESGDSFDSGATANTIETIALNRTDITYVPVIITAGGKAAPGGSVRATASPASGSASPAGNPLGSAVSAAIGRSRFASATSSGTTGTGISTAGMPRVTQNAGLLLGGAVAAAGVAYGGM